MISPSSTRISSRLTKLNRRRRRRPHRHCFRRQLVDRSAANETSHNIVSSNANFFCTPRLDTRTVAKSLSTRALGAARARRQSSGRVSIDRASGFVVSRSS